MPEKTGNPSEVISFIRRRDYKFVRELGHGACGQTVLLHDEQIDQPLVCKKYMPYTEAVAAELFRAFTREIKLLHQVYHENVVRVFNHYLYPEKLAGFILMEYIDGNEIDEYLAAHPEQVNEVFLQTVRGFSHLERAGILHRDIRPGNLMVRNDGVVKIVDLGFGKRVETPEDFDKSISLNWWCEPPDEFAVSTYDFRTEVYFVGKLFERMIHTHNISHFKYIGVLRRMCLKSPGDRFAGFQEVEQSVAQDLFHEIEFSDAEIAAYREFANELVAHITKIENSAKYVTDVTRIEAQLTEAHRGFMLEEFVPDASVVIGCFITGRLYYRRQGMVVEIVRRFVRLLQSVTSEKKAIILRNLHANLDSINRFEPEFRDDDIPF